MRVLQREIWKRFFTFDELKLHDTVITLMENKKTRKFDKFRKMMSDFASASTEYMKR